MKKLSDFVMEFIEGLGVRHVFMLPGGGSMHLVDSLGKRPGLSCICNLHEQAAAIAAEAYGQYTNSLGVCLVTTGPGGTNTVTGVAGAWLDSTPVLFISGQVKRADRAFSLGVRQMGFQETDIVSLVRPITKYAVTIDDPSSIRYHLEKAVSLARQGRPGPVWLDIPLDVQAAMVYESCLAAYEPEEADPSGRLSEQVLIRVIELLNQAERPVILAGNGIRLSGAVKDFLELIGLLNIPVLTTWKTIDLLAEDHPLYAGRPGAVGQRGANFVQQNADLIMTIGARLDLGQTAYSHEQFARAARKIVVDIDPHEIAKLRMVIELPVCAEAGAFIRGLLSNSAGVEEKDRTGWLGRCRSWKERYPVVLPEYREEKGYVNDYLLIDTLSDEMAANDLLIPGSSGACSERTMQAFRVSEGMRVFNTEGLGSMGFGIPAAIGGCLASRGRRTVCIDGDGGFVMNIQELETVRRLHLPIKFFVLNNGGYGSIRAMQQNHFSGHYVCCSEESGLTLPDCKAVAAAFGIPVFRIRDHSRINEQVREVLDAEGPAVCEVMVSPAQVTAPRVATRRLEDGSMVSLPMEDMWPFLGREEFRENMLIQPAEGWQEVG